MIGSIKIRANIIEIITKNELIRIRKDWIILNTTSLILAEIPLMTSLVFLATWTSYGWYRVFL